ncbi:hypothetical protein JCM33374_g23 [Metschnikowia sp. JCM 33374]|nr:hypothetical protein JCM33374_g23 [Metschnikowia sp. JCM 33374]
MSGQVYLNPSQLSILSIPRDKVWIFSSAILKLLHQEAQNTPQSTFKSDADRHYQSSDESSDTESETSDDSFQCDGEDVSKMTSSAFSDQSFSKRALLTKNTSRTDNSSKCGPAGSSSESLSDLANEAHHSDSSSSISGEDHHFFHIAYTPSECTVIFPTQSISQLFDEPLLVCEKLGYSDVILLGKSYLNLQVDSDGEFNNSAKILELTKPLSQHNISLFFLSTHFTNIVLIPYDLKDKVIDILSENDFIFSDFSNSYISKRGFLDSTESLTVQYDESWKSHATTTTMKFLAETNIMPKIHRKVKLLLTGARPGEVKQSILKASQSIAASAVPRYFSITRSSFSEISLILPGSSKQRALMGFDFRSIIGSASDVIIPIEVDLSKLPIDSAGIVAGLASSLLESVRFTDDPAAERFDMNYLSMARSAVVLIPQENLEVVTKMVNNMRDNLRNKDGELATAGVDLS